MPLYRVAPAGVRSGFRGLARGVACRCCPGGISRSAAPPPLPLGHERRRAGSLRATAAASGLAGGQGRPPVPRTACATLRTASGT